MAKALEGKSALVTGGAGGFGSASARLLARDGAAVVLMGRTAATLEATAAKIRGEFPEARVAVHVGDGMRDEDVRAAVKTAADRHGGLDIVVATVGGGGGGGRIADIDADTFMSQLEFNVRPAFLAIHEALPAMPRGGSFVFISSTAAVITFKTLSAYCAGKAALDHLVRCAADELGAKGYRFNAVRPGLTRTEATTGLMNNAPMIAKFMERTPMERTGEADEIAQAVRYFAGPESSWTTGQSFAVDGGNELRGAPPFG
jgi:NAD(P)-dependent dehydrogenase (short-subunit alcohol dehydrogenase family)